MSGHQRNETDEGDQLYRSVVAKLKRPPQDGLQAAVVLEAWGGTKAPYSFSVSPPAVDEAVPAGGGTVESDSVTARIGEMAAMAIVVVSAIVWVPILRAAHGEAAVTALRWALPVALALDWAIRVRYLGSGNVRALRPMIGVLVGVLAAPPALAALLWRWGDLGPTVVMLLGLAVVWGQVSIAVVRRWSWIYGAMVAAATGALAVSGGSLWVLVVAAMAVSGLSVWAVTTESAGVRSRPEPWPVAVDAAVIGGGTGVVLMADAANLYSAGWGVLAAMVTLTVAGWVASIRLSLLWRELPRQLSAVPVLGYHEGLVSQAFRRITVAALAFVAGPAVLLVLAAVFLGDGTGVTVLVSYGLFTVANLVVSLNLLTRRWRATAFVVAVGAMIAMVLAAVVPGLALAGGSLFILVVGGAIVAHTFVDAAAAFSTRMMIS